MNSPIPRETVPVAIVGAGPVGLAMALGLARQGVRSVVLEQNPTLSEHSKAAAIHVRTREVFRQWDVDEAFRAEGTLLEAVRLHRTAPGDQHRPPFLSVDFSELEAEAQEPGLLILEQSRTEALLLDAVRASGFCEVRFCTRVVALDQDDERVTLRVENVPQPTGRNADHAATRPDRSTDGRGEKDHSGAARTLRAGFVVGCDGARSSVRRFLGLPFEGSTYSLRPMLADVRIDDGRDGLPWPRFRMGSDGSTAALRLADGLWRIIHLGPGPGDAAAARVAGGTGDREEVGEDEVDARQSEVLGPGAFHLVWASRFRIHLRSSPRFRVGRVLLAGDSAHVHSPAGGLGMNAGIQDAHNLAWKLATALRGGNVDRLLESYHQERRPLVVENVSRFADVATRRFLQAPRLLRTAAFGLTRTLLRVGAIRRRALRRTSMIGLAYGPSDLLPAGARGAGARLPDPLVQHGHGAEARLHALLPPGGQILEVKGPALRILSGLAPGSVGSGPAAASTGVGPGGQGLHDPSGLLASLVGRAGGWIVVRPDRHVASIHPTLGAAQQAFPGALGLGADDASAPSTPGQPDPLRSPHRLTASPGAGEFPG